MACAGNNVVTSMVKLIYHLCPCQCTGPYRSTVRSTPLSGATSSRGAGSKAGARLPSEAELGAAVRRLADHRRPGDARPPGRPAWSNAAPAPAPSSRPPRCGQGAVVRPADSRPRRHRDLRADLPGHDGVAARAPARAGLGQRRAAPARKRIAPGSCAGSTSSAASPGCSSRRSSRRRTRTMSTCGSSTRSTRHASRSCCSTGRRCPTRRRGHHDLVGIDNRRAGYVITEHVLRLGSRRVALRRHAAGGRHGRRARGRIPRSAACSQGGTRSTAR